MSVAAVRITLLLSALAAALPARAGFHLWSVAEIFSSAAGKVRFIELVALSGGLQFVAGHTLTVSGGTGAPRVLTSASNLPGDSAGRRFLVGSAGFAGHVVVAPDYVVPDGFLSTGAGTIDFAGGAHERNHPAMPTNGTLSLSRNGTSGTNSPRDFTS